MSVVVWDGRVMAAESQGSYGDLIERDAFRKVFIKHGIAYGIVGDPAQYRLVHEWVSNGADIDNPPILKESSALVVKKGKGYCCHNDTGFIEVSAPYAIGSGADLARGALYAGASAILAVEICTIHHIHCGGDINTVEALGCKYMSSEQLAAAMGKLRTAQELEERISG